MRRSDGMFLLESRKTKRLRAGRAHPGSTNLQKKKSIHILMLISVERFALLWACSRQAAPRFASVFYYSLVTSSFPRQSLLSFLCPLYPFSSIPSPPAAATVLVFDLYNVLNRVLTTQWSIRISSQQQPDFHVAISNTVKYMDYWGKPYVQNMTSPSIKLQQFHWFIYI